MAKRTFWKSNKVGGYYTNRREELSNVPREDANLASSLCDNGKHAPVIDIDFPARLVPSKTPGHYHLYLDVEMPWAKYQRLLRSLLTAGIIDKNFYDLTIEHKQSFARVADRDPVVMMECSCGAMIVDMEKHAEHHERQREHSHQPTLLAGG